MNLKELDSFNLSDAIKFHKSLNPNLWQHNRLRPEVKKQLKKIAQDFIEELGVSGLDVADLTVSGSNAAYSYTPHSDLDLHVLVDMNKLTNDDVYRELFTAKKTIYNDTHNIKIHGVPVELYVQDVNQPVISLGEYSLLQDKWIKMPAKKRANFDQAATKHKYEKLLALVKHAMKYKDINKLENVIKKIRQYRQAGLDKGGEFSPENLAYKALRNQDYITKLYDLRDRLHSEELTIETMYNQRLLDRPTLNARMLAAKHNVPVKHILDQLKKGIQVEKEHTTYGQTAREIALDHLAEDPNYYTKLKKANLEEEKYDELPEKVYHVTPSENLDNIMSKGLVPDVGDRARKIPDEKHAVYCFPDKNSMEDAVMNWLGDEFDEDTQLALLEIYTTGLKGQVTDGAEYEVAITSIIPPQNIRILSKDLATPITESIVTEAFDQPYPIKWEKGDHGDLDALAKLPDGSPLSIMFNQQKGNDGEEYTQVEFYRNNSQEVTGEGDAQRIFATVLTAIQQYVKKRKPLGLTFAASKQVDPSIMYGPDDPQPNPESRAKLYDRLVQRYAKAWGYRAFRADNGDLVMYELSRINKGVKEDDTMQYAASKIPPTNPYGGLRDYQYRGSISEIRTNPEQNIKPESGMKELASIAKTINDPQNWAISMTSEPKLGINPQVGISEDTPKGIYFYPLNYALDKTRYGKLPWGHDYPYIQLFQYDRSGEMTKETQVDPAKLKQALRQYCSDELIQSAIDDPEYDGTPYWFIYDCLSRLGKSDETNIVRWNKVLRDLGFTSVFDDGHGWIAYNEPTQGVVLDPRIIKQHKTISNKKQSRVVTPAVIEQAIFETMDMELAANRVWQKYDPDGSKIRQAAKEYAKKPEFKQWFGKSGSEEIFDKAASWGRYGARQLSQEAYEWYKEQQGQSKVNEASGYIPSEKEKNDPRFSTALTVDVKPDSIKKNAKAFYSKVSRAGIPPTLNTSGKY